MQRGKRKERSKTNEHYEINDGPFRIMIVDVTNYEVQATGRPSVTVDRINNNAMIAQFYRQYLSVGDKPKVSIYPSAKIYI